MAPEGNTATGGLRGRRVLVFPLPYQGHINPMFQLAGLLHVRGFAVTVFHAHFNAPDPSRQPAYDFVPVPDGMPAGSPDTAKVTVERVLTMNSSCEMPFRERLAALLEPPGARDDVACLVADAHLLTLMDVARLQGVPTLALRTGSAACFRNITANPMLCDKGYLPAQESQLDAPVRELPPYRVRDLMTIGRSCEEHDLLCKLLSRAVEAVRTSSGLILNTFDALETDELATTRQDLGLPVFDIGPLHKISPAVSSSLLLQERACLEWLDAQAPASVLYISFGSLANMSSADLAEAAWGIANSGLSFLWVLRSDLVRGVAQVTLPDGFGAMTRNQGMIVSWAPQVEVLTHAAVGGFWTHCGWNSTLEDVCGGMPMLCRPYFGDQMGNARYVEHVWRAGFVLDCELERSKVEEAIRRLMQSKEGDVMRERARELRSRAAEAITEAGSSRLNIDKLVNHILSLKKSGPGRSKQCGACTTSPTHRPAAGHPPSPPDAPDRRCPTTTHDAPPAGLHPRMPGTPPAGGRVSLTPTLTTPPDDPYPDACPTTARRAAQPRCAPGRLPCTRSARGLRSLSAHLVFCSGRRVPFFRGPGLGCA